MSLENVNDRFELRILFTANPLAGWESACPFLEVLLREAGELAPTKFRPSYDRIVPLTIDTVKRHFSRRNAPDVLVFSNDQGVGVEWTGYPPGNIPGSKLIIRIPFSLLNDLKSAERVLTLTKALCGACPPIYGWGHSEEDMRLANDPHSTDASAPQELLEVYWLTIFGAQMVKKLNRSHVVATPAYRIEVLDNESVIIVTSPLPGECLSPAARESQAKALAHLRPDKPADQILKNLLDRSAKLQPVEEHGDPDLAELFRMIVDSVPLSDRRATALELKSYHIPEISEWRTASEALPSNVDDIAETVDSYHRQGQTFVARFHDEIPGLMEAEPDVLPRIDGYFYSRDHVRKDTPALQLLLIPTLGAYLGTMIERLLDGRWIPRRNSEESQIIVGDRAWLPFLRVKRYLQSKQAVIDYSFTKYYREVERHTTNTIQ